MPLLDSRPPGKEKAALAGATFKSTFQKKSYQNPHKKQGRFDRALLPTPAAVLQRLSIKIGNTNSAGYLALTCPFHKSGQEQNPSLNLHATGGYYRCHSCGAHGGDILAFYMDVTGRSFRDAAHELGAWRDDV